MIHVILFIPLFTYAILWIYFIVGCQRKAFNSSNHLKSFSITIVIPFRNESHRIDDLLISLDDLDETACELNILFIDDHSLDDGKEKINSWKNKTQKKVQLIELNQTNEFGKKRAIKKGIDHSYDDWIFTLDADSKISKHFLQKFKSHISENKEMYLLPVVENSSGFSLSVIESYMLSIIAFASANNHAPILANGTGMIFKRNLFLQLDPYNGNYHIASGDDLFFLEKVNEKEPSKITAITAKELIIETHSPNSYANMLSRSARWVSKMNQSNLHYTKIIGLVVILCNLSILASIGYSIFQYDLKILLSIISLKFFFDIALFSMAVKFYGNKKLIFKTPMIYLFYPLHLLIVMIYLMIGNKSWKGRKI